jgi:hypothetical protein
MSRFISLLLCVAFIVGLAGCTIHDRSTPKGTVMQDGSVYLGWTLISRKQGDDWMLVGAKHGYFSSLRFNVEDRPIKIDKLVVEFGGGEQWTAPAKGKFQPGAWSDEIPFPAPKTIEKVTFYGKAGGKKAGMAKVNLYGRR